MSTEARITCDAFGCGESHPVDFPERGEPGFEPGRWLGWLYLDLNLPHMFERELRFCDVACLVHWCDMYRFKQVREFPLDKLLKEERLSIRAAKTTGDQLALRRLGAS